MNIIQYVSDKIDAILLPLLPKDRAEVLDYISDGYNEDGVIKTRRQDFRKLGKSKGVGS